MLERVGTEERGTQQKRTTSRNTKRHTQERQGMERLSIWLLLVGFLRFTAVYFGFFDVWALRLAVFSKLDVSKWQQDPSSLSLLINPLFFSECLHCSWCSFLCCFELGFCSSFPSSSCGFVAIWSGSFLAIPVKCEMCKLLLIATLSSSSPSSSLRTPALFVCLFLNTVADVHGRTFAVWTLLTCTLCVLCALNLSNRALYQATFLSFVYALGYFLIECFIYGTMAPKNVASLFIFAGTCRPQHLLSCKRLDSVLGLFSHSPSLSLSKLLGFVFVFFSHSPSLCKLLRLGYFFFVCLTHPLSANFFVLFSSLCLLFSASSTRCIQTSAGCSPQACVSYKGFICT